MIDLADHPSWRWHDQPELGPINDRMLLRKDARVNGRIYVPHYTRKAG